jgi:hypothetical protein
VPRRISGSLISVSPMNTQQGRLAVCSLVGASSVWFTCEK